MHEEDILLRSIRGTAYLAIAPCILLSSAVWFTSDSTGIVIANLFHVYFCILLFFIFGKILSLQSNFEEQYKSHYCEDFMIGKILKVSKSLSNGKPGTVMDENLTISCKSNSVQILELQKEGKNKQTVREFLLGNKISKDESLA